MWDAGLEGWLICSVLQVCFKKCAADKMKGVSSSERGNMNAAVLRSPQRELMSMCVSAGTTMCFTTCWLEPVTRRGRPSTCSNLRNTTTSTRSAHKNTNTDVDSKVNADFWTDFTLISYVTKCLKSRFYGGKKKKSWFPISSAGSKLQMKSDTNTTGGMERLSQQICEDFELAFLEINWPVAACRW